MKATGIVRRIDDLGRVVIPKEIRRTLRIHEGDPLEIYTDANGEVIFKKYSPVGEMSGFAEQYAEVLSKVARQPVLISDNDHIVAAAGISKKEMLERRISPMLEDYIMGRKSYFAGTSGVPPLYPVENIERNAAIMYPIIAAGDVTGSVILLFNESNTPPTETENKLIQTAAAFLGRQSEEAVSCRSRSRRLDAIIRHGTHACSRHRSGSLLTGCRRQNNGTVTLSGVTVPALLVFRSMTALLTWSQNFLYFFTGRWVFFLRR